MEPSTVLLQENGYVPLLLNSGSLRLLLSFAMQRSELVVCLGSSKSRRTIPYLPQKTVCITLHNESCVLNFFFDGEFVSPFLGLLFLLHLIVMTPWLIINNGVIQETVTFSLVLVQKVLTKLHIVFFLLRCEHSWDQQMSWCRCSSFPGATAVWNMAFLSCCCCPCWNVPPHCFAVLTSSASSPLMFSKCWRKSMGAIFFHTEESNDTPFLHTYFHDRLQFVRLPSVTWQQHITGY